jgi:5-methyltetrahydrofolate--homocysteine methyltransferase
LHFVCTSFVCNYITHTHTYAHTQDKDYDLSSVLPFIDWNPFFAVWQLRGKYPNRNYPKIFNDETVGTEAKRLFDEAYAMLIDLIETKKLTGRCVIGIYPAQGAGDDINVTVADNETLPEVTLRTLRQQNEHDTVDQPYLALSDFVAPAESGVQDYVGMFACSAGFGVDEMSIEFKKTHDDYKVSLSVCEFICV